MSLKKKEEIYNISAKAVNMKTSVKKMQPTLRYFFKKYKKKSFEWKMATLAANNKKNKRAHLLFEVMLNLKNNIEQKVGASFEVVSLEGQLGRGSTCRRKYRPVGRGRMHPIVKHRAHLEVKAMVREKK